MHASYEDITEIITQSLRSLHDERATSDERPPDGCSFEPGVGCRCVGKPQWWDENGVPRFAPHAPKLCPDIYADEVVLLSVECQSCERAFQVQISWGPMEKFLSRGGEPRTKPRTLAEDVLARIVDYGDPPRHDDDGHGRACSAGDTMGAITRGVLEYWLRDPAERDWRRDDALEGEWCRHPDERVVIEEDGDDDGEVRRFAKCECGATTRVRQRAGEDEFEDWSPT